MNRLKESGEHLFKAGMVVALLGFGGCSVGKVLERSVGDYYRRNEMKYSELR